MAKILAKYGSWKSSVSATKIADGSISLSQVIMDDADIYWIEGRPSEKGRSVIVRLDRNGSMVDVIDQRHSARTRVHEYGGGSYDVS